jgi:hypothetical protein
MGSDRQRNNGDFIMAVTTKRKRSGRKAPSAKKGSYYDRMIVQPAARLIAAISKKAKTVAAR